ncbi:hypothetical protein G7054_g12435 [Neopestalotiopsis clavispora]|nr:hypothetical protein G7054_g12435 [Neopestalotiopsis clavispora]
MAPSMVLSDSGNQNTAPKEPRRTELLDVYLKSPLNVVEGLSLSPSSQSRCKFSQKYDKAKKTGQYLKEWDESWQRSTSDSGNS